jgi:ribonuclease P/MRP protein subunit POP1
MEFFIWSQVVVTVCGSATEVIHELTPHIGNAKVLPQLFRFAPGDNIMAGTPSRGNKRKAPIKIAERGGKPGKNDNDAARQKRVRLATQGGRDIPIQTSDAALKDGELDLQAFLNARAFEIKALEESMQLSKVNGASRAFQQVPRSMRRRVASHNAKRVPKRLQRRAKREMLEDNTPTVIARKRRPRTTRARLRAETAKKLGLLADLKRKRMLKSAQGKATELSKDKKALIMIRPPRPKIRRNLINDPPKQKSKFRKRQLHKTWLPTHLWHAKRAKMTDPKEPLWRFAIPLTPNEKCYRPTHRSQGESGAIAWDMSYMSTISLCGNEAHIEKVLRNIGVDHESYWNDKGRKWRLGLRHLSIVLNKYQNGTQRDICPATVFWNPRNSATSPHDDVMSDSNDAQRQIFVRVHPSAFLELFKELCRLVKLHGPRLYVEDLRYEIGSIDITGPSSTEALLGILRPYHTRKDMVEQHADMFRNLNGLSNPGALPTGALLGFSIADPRLLYPTKRGEVTGTNEAQQAELCNTLADWPAEKGLKPFDIFDRDYRYNATKLPSQKSLNKRRTQSSQGSHLKITDVDPPIPIVVLAARAPTGTQVQGTWTVLIPQKCVLAVWYKLIHFPLSSGGNPRFGGLDELRQVAFERGLPCFPFDYLGTTAGVTWEREQREKRKKTWEKRPKSKRVEWKSLDLGSSRKGEVGTGWSCDFEYIFRASNPQPGEENCSSSVESDAMDVDESSNSNGVEENDTGQSDQTLGKLRQLSKPNLMSLLTKPNIQLPPPRFSILSVSIQVLGRGVVSTCARIYRLPSRNPRPPPSTDIEVRMTALADSNDNNGLPGDLRDQWLGRIPNTSTHLKAKQPYKTGLGSASGNASLQARKRAMAKSLISTELPYPPPKPNSVDIGGHPLVPNEEDLIGFVTTGSFCLTEGRATCIGSIAAEKVIGDLRNNKMAKEARICIVRNAGENVGWVARWELTS